MPPASHCPRRLDCVAQEGADTSIPDGTSLTAYAESRYTVNRTFQLFESILTGEEVHICWGPLVFWTIAFVLEIFFYYTYWFT